MASIFRRKENGKFLDRYYVKYRDDKGRQRLKAGYKSLKATKQLAAEIERKVERRQSGLEDEYADYRLKPLIEHLTDFEAHLKARGVSEKHQKVTNTRLENAFDLMNVVSYEEIIPSRVDALTLALSDKGFANKTINDYLSALKEFCQWGITSGRWTNNPLSQVKLLNAEVDIRRQRRPLTTNELNRLLSTCPSEERRIRYMTAAYSGLRLNELKTLKWANLDLEANLPTVTIEAKNSKAKRIDTIPLNDQLAEELQNWRHLNKESEFVFRIPRHYMKFYRRDLQTAGIREIDEQGRIVDFHSLRHTYATMLSLAGVPPRQAQALLRHADINTTMKKYTHIEVMDLSRQANLLPQISTAVEKVAVGCENINPSRYHFRYHLSPIVAHSEDMSRTNKSENPDFENASEASKIKRYSAPECVTVSANEKSQKFGAAGFEPTTSCTQGTRAKPNCATPRLLKAAQAVSMATENRT